MIADYTDIKRRLHGLERFVSRSARGEKLRLAYNSKAAAPLRTLRETQILENESSNFNNERTICRFLLKITFPRAAATSLSESPQQT